MRRNPSESYLEKAKSLSKEEFERLLSSPKIRALKKNDKWLTALECVALQLEIDDEHLNEWRKNAARIREMEKPMAQPPILH